MDVFQTPQGAVIRIDQITSIIPHNNNPKCVSIYLQGDARCTYAEWDTLEDKAYAVDHLMTQMRDVKLEGIDMTLVNEEVSEASKAFRGLCWSWRPMTPSHTNLSTMLVDAIKDGLKRR